MYRLEWVEQLKLRTVSVPSPEQVTSVNQVVWRLGFTSLLTDISAEMVNSILPLYLVLHLHVSPLAFGTIDGIYHGTAVALLSLTGGLLADRWRRHKEVAAAGYGISALCKLGLLAAGTAWGWIGAVIALDRVGKGARVAPRDALLSLNSSRETLATSFAVHRALDAGGSLLGPIVAFALLSFLPGAYNALWLTSFAFALLGMAVLLLFVENPPKRSSIVEVPPSSIHVLRLLGDYKDFRAIALAGGALAAATLSDGFVYLLLQKQSGMQAQFFPLYYVTTATFYMILSIPVGRLADRVGRRRVLLSGYGTLFVIYLMMASGTFVSGFPLIPLVLFGLFYAATEGVLTAMASATIPADLRTSGLAILTTIIGFGKMVSSIAFGWFWHTQDIGFAVMVLAAMLAGAVLISIRLFWIGSHEQKATI